MKLFKQHQRFIKFSLVAALYNIATYLFYALLIFLHCNYLFASSTSFIFGIMLSYFMNKNLVFAEVQNHNRLIIGYFLYYGLLLGASLAMLYGFIDLLKLNPYFAQLLVILISAVISYNFLCRLFARRASLYNPAST